jgi:hypothetical protein
MRKLALAAWLLSAALAAATVGSAAALAAPLRVCPSAGPACSFTSIQAAINAAQTNASISIAAGTYHERLTVGASAAASLTLVGEGGASGVTIDATGLGGPVLTVAAGHSVNLVGLTLTHGSAANGGGIDNEGGTVSLQGVHVVGNTASGLITQGAGFGGGIFNGGTLRATASVISGNTATRGGGMINGSETGTGSAVLTSTRVENNTARAAAGGIANCAPLEMTSSSINDNTAAQGGGLTNCDAPGTARLVSTPVTGNHATGGVTPEGFPLPGRGGGIANGGVLTLIGSPVTNTAPAGQGSGIFNGSFNPETGTVGPATLSLIGSPVTGNTAPPQCVNVPGC